MAKDNESIRSQIEKIKEKVINQYLNNISQKAWTTKTFYWALANNLDGNCENIKNIVKELYSKISSYIENAEFSKSNIRGELRGFRAISERTINALGNNKSKKLEVALERVLAAANTDFTCEFSCLSGFRKQICNRGIDLVKGQKDEEKGYLIELKGWTWEVAGHPFYAAIEIITYFFAFLLVRKRENKKFPNWNEFKLRVMAPEVYFEFDKENISEKIHIEKIFKYLDEGLQELELQNNKKLNCVKYNLNKIKLKISQAEFKEIVENNKDQLCNKSNNHLLNKAIINEPKLELKKLLR